MGEDRALTVVQSIEIVPASGITFLLQAIRPAWQARSLIERVMRLVSVDPSSACQRLFNAAVHDLREKIVVAGIDIATEVATTNKLPPVAKPEDVMDNYSTSNVLDLAYRMGLLDRAEWKRMRRAYDIRCDLEHEDDEYEAQAEDIFYIFKTSVEAVLSRDPVELIRVKDAKDLIEVPSPVTPSSAFYCDYERAPDTRQREIGEFLISVALDSSRADIVRQNAVQVLGSLEPGTRNAVKIELARRLQDRVKDRRLTLAQAKVASAGGFLPYLKQALVRGFFLEILTELEQIGYQWNQNDQHGAKLDDLEDVGGLLASPPAVRARLVLWMTLCYLGKPGGYGTMGHNRPVFYSNSGARRIERMFKTAGGRIKVDLIAAGKDDGVRDAVQNKHIARRYEELLDMVESGD